MTPSNAGSPKKIEEAKLPLRDWILLPLLSLLTTCLLAASTEFIARRVFSGPRPGAVKTGVENCMVLNDPTTSARAIPNSVCSGKLLEGPQIEYRFNSCGHRAGMECGPKPPGTYRIVLVGSSFAMGDGVRREDTFAAMLPSELSRLTGHKIELYNEGMGWGTPHSVSLRFNEVLEAKPDLILWILTPWDIDNASLDIADLGVPDPADRPKTSIARFLRDFHNFEHAMATGSIQDALNIVRKHTLTPVLVQHFLFESQSFYVKSYLWRDDSTELFRTELDAQGQNLFQQADGYAADIEARAEAAGIPLVAVLLPNRVQAAMISMREWPAGFDPYKMDNELRTIVVNHGEIYIDILPYFRTIPNPEQYYFPVDGHPNASGHAAFSALIAKELTSGAIPALRASGQSQSARGQGR